MRDSARLLYPYAFAIIARYISIGYGDIAQLGERCVRNAEVGGSNPPISTMHMPL